MTTIPQLLNDDGSASVATAIMTSHHGFRRDLEQFSLALGRLSELDAERVAALSEEWTHFRHKLHGHHTAEDTGLFPSLRAQHPSLTTVIEGLDADHRRIAPLLADGDRAFAELSASAGTATEVVERLRTLLAPHLATEEAQLFPWLRAAKQFPPPATEEELALYAEGFAWSCHGVAPEVVERLNDILPAALVERLPAARAAFAARYQRVWGSARAGAARTPLPEWIP